MKTYDVDIGGKTYEVDAPDPDTAWRYAQSYAETQKAKPYDSLPAGIKSVMNMGQALTFGFGDEILGGLGLVDKDRYRATVDQFRQEYPGSAMLGSLSASALLPLGAGKMAVNAPWTTAATVGGATGMLQGAGDAPTRKEALPDAVKGGAFGMVAGPAILGMAKPIGSVASALASKVPFVGDDLTKLLARNRVVDSFARDSADAKAVEQQMLHLGGEARIADAAGENTRTLLDLNANLPGTTQDKLERVIRSRIASRPDRLDQVVDAVSGGVGRAKSLTDALTAQQKGVASPLYKRAFGQSVEPSPQLIRDLEAARKLGAFGEAQKRSLANPSEYGPFSLDPAQQVLGGGKIGVNDIDHIKHGLDGLIDGQINALGKTSGYGRDLIALKNRILGEVDKLVPDYGAARNAFAGPASLKTAIEKGRKFWGENAESLSSSLSGMTKSEQDAFRVGAAEALREKVGAQSGQTQLLNIWKDRTMREKLSALLGDDVKYSQVEKILNSESELKRLEALGVSRNSRTFSREAAAEDQGMQIARDAFSMGVNAKTGNIPGLLMQGKSLAGRISTPENVRNAIGDILLQRYQPAELKALIEAQKKLFELRAATAAGFGSVAGRSDIPKK